MDSNLFNEFKRLQQEALKYKDGDIISEVQYNNYLCFLVNQFENIEVFWNSLLDGSNRVNEVLKLKKDNK